MKCKGKIFIGFWICEGGANNEDERGLFANRGGWDECPSLGHLAGYGGEREREIFVVEVCGSEWKKMEFWNCWNLGKWNSCGLWRKEEK